MKAAKETADKIKDVVATLDVVAVEEDSNGKTKKSKLHIAVSIKNFILKIVDKIRSHFTVEYEEGWGDENAEPNETPEITPEEVPEIEVSETPEEVVVIEDNSVVPEAELIAEPIKEEVVEEVKPVVTPTTTTKTNSTLLNQLQTRKRR